MSNDEKKELLAKLRANPGVVPDLNGTLCKIVEALPDRDSARRTVSLPINRPSPAPKTAKKKAK